MSWPLTVAQTFALVALVLLVSVIVFARMCVRAIDESLDREDEPSKPRGR